MISKFDYIEHYGQNIEATKNQDDSIAAYAKALNVAIKRRVPFNELVKLAKSYLISQINIVHETGKITRSSYCKKIQENNKQLDEIN